jgi:hypothetical protein
MALERADLVTLMRYNTESDKPDPWELPTEPIQRLLKAGLIDERLNLTAEGRKTFNALLKKLDVLKKGVPFPTRKKRNPKAMYSPGISANLWRTGSVAKKGVVTNGQILFVGKPPKGMEHQQGSSDERQMFPSVVAEQVRGKAIQVEPVFYQTSGSLDGPELVWLGGANGENVRVAIQAMYYDFVEAKYPSAKLFAQEDPKKAVQVRCPTKGVTKHSVVALIMPFLAEGWEVPKG